MATVRPKNGRRRVVSNSTTKQKKSAESRRRSRIESAKKRLHEMPKTYGEYTTLSLEELNVGEYQRPLNDSWVDRIVQDYDPSLFQPLTVALREADNEYYVVDGQHRLEAARILGLKRVPCILFMDMDLQHEAKQFVGLQEARIALGPSQKFHAKLMAQDPETMAVQAILVKHGFRVANRAYHSSAVMSDEFTAAAMLANIYRMSEPNGEILDKTLAIMRAAWNGSKESLTASITRGLAIFLKRYSDNPLFSQAALIEKLRSYHARDITTRTTAISSALGCNYATAAAQSFLELYNHNRRLRLPGAILEA